MLFDWTADVVGRMHAAEVTGLELAKEAGVSNSYLSAVLHGKKGDNRTRQRIIAALERLEQRRTESNAVNSTAAET